MMRSDVVEVLFLRDGRSLKQHFDPNSQISIITSTTGNPATAFFLFRFLVELKAGRELDIVRVSCCCLISGDTCAWSVLGSLSHEGWVGGWVCLAPRGSEAASEEPAPGHHGFQKRKFSPVSPPTDPQACAGQRHHCVEPTSPPVGSTGLTGAARPG